MDRNIHCAASRSLQRLASLVPAEGRDEALLHFKIIQDALSLLYHSMRITKQMADAIAEVNQAQAEAVFYKGKQDAAIALLNAGSNQGSTLKNLPSNPRKNGSNPGKSTNAR